MASTKILILGDSQVNDCLRIYGFGSHLNDRFTGYADIVLRKFPGYTAEWVKSITSSLLKNVGSTPDYVILMLGRDDCLRRVDDNRPVTDAKKFGKNLDLILEKVTNELDIKLEQLIVISPLPVHNMRLQSNFRGLSLDERLLTEYTTQCRKVAAEVGARFINTSELLDRALDSNIKDDGYTLSPDGHILLADELEKQIEVLDSPYPTYDKVASVDELKKIAADTAVVAAENIAAYTYVATVDQYSAYFTKSYNGKV